MVLELKYIAMSDNARLLVDTYAQLIGSLKEYPVNSKSLLLFKLNKELDDLYESYLALRLSQNDLLQIKKADKLLWGFLLNKILINNVVAEIIKREHLIVKKSRKQFIESAIEKAALDYCLGAPRR